MATKLIKKKAELEKKLFILREYKKYYKYYHKWSNEIITDIQIKYYSFKLKRIRRKINGNKKSN